jgi:hypothetical protein
MRGKALLLALVVVATTCSPGPQSGASPAATDQRTLQPTTMPSSSATLTPSASPPTTPAPNPTPVARTISGRATLTSTGAGVAGVRVRGTPMPINDGRVPGPDVTAVTDDRGAYSFSILTWSPEALANSSSFQMMIQVIPPPGLLVLGVTKTQGGPPGTSIGSLAGPLILADLDPPIDITLGPGHIVEGIVTSGVTGTPLAEIRVNALGLNSMLIHGGVGDAFEIAATAETDAGGSYRLTVPSGAYVIYTSGRDGGESRFWSDDPAVFQATRLSVERSVAGIDLALVPTTRIEGQVRSGPTFAEGVEGTRVAAYLAGGTPCCRTVSVATSGPAGSFLMYVPRGTYRIVFDPPAASPYAAQWWRGASGFATATDVIVGAEQVLLEVELAPRR